MKSLQPNPADDVLIAIPCLNEERHLASLLDGLLADPGAKGAKIVIVDGGSADQTLAIAERYAERHPEEITVLKNPKRVQSVAVNLAARTFAADRTWLLRMDVHCRYPPDFVQRLKTAATGQGADNVVVPIRSVGETCFESAVAAAQNSKLGTGGARHRHEGKSCWVDHGHHALFRLDRFFEIGGYDESFSHNEDAEFDVRIQRSGYSIWLQGDLVVDYIPRSDAISLFKQYYRYGRGRARNFLIHRRRLKVRQVLPLMLVPAMGLALFTPVSYWAAAPSLIWLSFVLLAGAILGLRRRQWCDAGSGAPAAVMHLAWSAGFGSQLIISSFRPLQDRRPIPSPAVDVT